MIDREIVAKIARAALDHYDEWGKCGSEEHKQDAVLATVDEFTPEEDDEDAIAAEAKRIYDCWLALNAKPEIRWWLQQQWARERVAWRKEREANSQ